MRTVRRILVGGLLLLVLLVLAATMYERIQSQRAQKMLDAMRRSAVRGVLRDAEVGKYASTQRCSSNECVQTYEFAKSPLSPLSRFRPTPVSPFLRDWVVTVEIHLVGEKMTSRSVEIWAQPAGTAVAAAPILRVKQPYDDYTSAFPCDPAEISLHPGYRVRRSARQSIIIVLATDAAPALVDKAFDINLSCLGSTDDSYLLCAKEIAPRALQDSVLDRNWLESHQDEAERICPVSNKDRATVIGGKSSYH
jgi:hypothetical protein